MDTGITNARVVSVTGSPGPASDIRVDIAGTSSDGSPVLYQSQIPYGLPQDFDIIIVPRGKVGVAYEGTGILFFCQWIPVTTDCAGGA